MHESPLRVQNLDESPSNKRRRRLTGSGTPSTSQLIELDNLPWLSDPNLDSIQPPLSTKERMVSWLSRNLEDKHVPLFIPLVSILQRFTPPSLIGLYYFIGFDKLLLPFGLDPYRRYEAWRYVTICLVHNTPLHLWVNIIGQLILGILLEISYNWVKICAIYCTSVIGGSISITIFSPIVYASGASAGQYGLLFGHLAALILDWHTASWRRLRLFLLILYLILDIGLAPVLQHLWGVQINVSNSAHVGGALAGFLVSIILLNNSASHKFESNLSRIAAGSILILLLVISISINVAFPTRYLQLESESLRFEYRKTHALHYERALLKSYTI